MKKKMWLFIAAVCILVVLAFTIIIANRPTPQDEMQKFSNGTMNTRHKAVSNLPHSISPTVMKNSSKESSL